MHTMEKEKKYSVYMWMNRRKEDALHEIFLYILDWHTQK